MVHQLRACMKPQLRDPHLWQVEPNHAESHEDSSNAEFQPLGDIYALGDCCANIEGPLPALAQVDCTGLILPLSSDVAASGTPFTFSPLCMYA